MALSLRLRRALALSSSLCKDRHFSSNPSSSQPLHLSKTFVAPSLLGNPSLRPHSFTQSLSFRSSSPLSDRRSDFGEDRKISPDEILFEGCDYNHWLITMDFPKDPKPTPEEMVETYVQTLAKVVGSVEEAKKRMYACSTTTYNGFQAVMTEEMSEKFRGLPGVVFILPDSYIDPVNKEYGGDKYDNGVITPRPPPIQYGRQGRYGDRNRNYDRPRYDRPRDSAPMQQGSPPNDRQGYTQGDGRNYAPQQNYNSAGQDGRGYGPPGIAPAPVRRDFGQGERRDYVPAGGRDGYQGERRDQMPTYQRDFSQGQGGNFPPQGQSNFTQGQGGNFPPQGHSNFSQGQGGNFPPQENRNFSQGQGGNFPQENRNFSQGQGGDFKYGGSSGSGSFGQGSSSSYGEGYRQGPNTGYTGDNRQGTGSGFAGDHGQGSGSGHEQSYARPVADPQQAKY